MVLVGRPALTWTVAALGVVLAGCGVDAKLQARTLCYTVKDAVVPGASGSGTVETDLGYDVGATLPDLTRRGVSYSLRLQDLELSPATSASLPDLAGLDELDVSVLPPPGSTLAEAELVHYVRQPGADPAHLRAAAERQVNLQPYLDGGQLSLHVLATGTPPTHPWTVDATACFQLEVDVRGSP